MPNHKSKTSIPFLLTLCLTLWCATSTESKPTVNNNEESVQTSPPIVDLGYATYQGRINASTGNTEFLGVRFAGAPIGELRWEAPKTPLPFTGGGERGAVLADTLPNKCIQTTSTGLGNSSPFVVQGSKQSSESIVGGPGTVEPRYFIDPPGMSEDCLFLK